MAVQQNSALTTPYFRTEAHPDPRASKEAGRPIFKNVDVVEIRIAGDRFHQPTYPVSQFWRRIDGEEKTYADRWPDEYARFKSNQQQVLDGTPLEELPFLDVAARATLKGQKVFTAEALASIDGVNIKALGMDGRRWKEQANAYLSKATGSASMTRMAAELAELKAKLASRDEVTERPSRPAIELPDFEAMDEETLKEFIQLNGGTLRPGRPSRESLIQTCKSLVE